MMRLPALFIAQLTETEVSVPNKGGLSGSVVSNLTNIALGVAGGVALIVVAYGGFKYIMSQGNSQETTKARDTIVYGMVGLGVVLLSTIIITFVVNRV